VTTATPFFTLDAATVQLVMLAVARLSGILLLTPPFTGSGLPVAVRLPLALALALPAWPALAAAAVPPARDAVGLGLLVGRELAIGLTIGIVGRLLVAAASYAAELVSMQMGFGLASMFDPELGAQVTPLTRLYDWTMLGMLLALDIHHLVLGAAVESFRAVPPGPAGLAAASAMGVVSLGGRIFATGLALVAPTLGLLFVTNLVLVVASRAVPQLSLIVVGWPITVLAGLLVLLGNIDLMGGLVAREVDYLQDLLIGLLRSLADGR
jgi:flagellar biosynthetic protein FliR